VNPVPAVVEMTAGPVATVLLTLSTLDELISLLMIDEIPDEEYYTLLERKIRIFLTHFADMEDTMPRKKRLPQWLSAYNFLSLLNLPEVVRQYGPIRNIWEGGAQGEGVLRFVKPNMNNGMRRSWELSCMKILMRKKALAFVVDPTVGTEANLSDDDSAGPKMYHSYPCVLVLDDVLRETRIVISCIQIEDGRWGFCHQSSGNDLFSPLSMSDIRLTCCGLNYFVWERQLQEEDEELDKDSIVAHGLLLPLLQYKLMPADPAFITHCYALVASDHRTLDDNGQLYFC
jgi:hypothetical protein